MDERGRDHGQEHYYCDYDCQERFRGNKPTCVFNLGIFYLRSGPYHLLFKYTRELESSLKKRWSELFVGSKDERCRDGTVSVVNA